MFLSFQDVGNRGSTAAAQALRHAKMAINLVRTGLTPQLRDQLHDLIDACRPNGMPPCLQATHGTDGNASLKRDLAVIGQPGALPALGKAAGFQ